MRALAIALALGVGLVGAPQAAEAQQFPNLRTAKAMGLTNPRPLLLRADDLIQ